MGEISQDIQASKEVSLEELEEICKETEDQDMEWDFDSDLVA
jgi:hypothetical protein